MTNLITIHQNFDLNVLFSGPSGVGKSCQSKTLYHWLKDNAKILGLKVVDLSDINQEGIGDKTMEIIQRFVVKIGDETTFTVRVIDTPGFFDECNVQKSIYEVLNYIAENRNCPARRISLVVYFINPSRFSVLDVDNMANISEFCYVVPLISRSDTYPVEFRKKKAKEIFESLNSNKNIRLADIHCKEDNIERLLCVAGSEEGLVRMDGKDVDAEKFNLCEYSDNELFYQQFTKKITYIDEQVKHIKVPSYRPYEIWFKYKFLKSFSNKIPQRVFLAFFLFTMSNFIRRFSGFGIFNEMLLFMILFVLFWSFYVILK